MTLLVRRAVRWRLWYVHLANDWWIFEKPEIEEVVRKRIERIVSETELDSMEIVELVMELESAGELD